MLETLICGTHRLMQYNVWNDQWSGTQIIVVMSSRFSFVVFRRLCVCVET